MFKLHRDICGPLLRKSDLMEFLNLAFYAGFRKIEKIL
ncbi:hypothetical protein LEP1GSC062_0281 [Leptospira alexanderi serovar Manhao 3 str. L 60]|uniref:Uncharacterized protein n=1 Tax=Leptospira alexanderi serovar Manhao 3 str. L 60 TaxID=1049759 RepID=V6HSL3_9LEPT|nr:hypothetical protein LEP1GSC062_0281 [Leptospira alexanderi serovar Manhao 3 str. L 60]